MHRPAFASLLVLLSLALASGCSEGDRARVQSFLPGPGGSFMYSARTNTVMTANDDGAAEKIRRGWLAETLGAHGMCNAGYVIYQRRLVVAPQRPALAPAPPNFLANADPDLSFGNTGDVVYTGACL